MNFVGHNFHLQDKCMKELLKNNKCKPLFFSNLANGKNLETNGKKKTIKCNTIKMIFVTCLLVFLILIY